MNIATIIRTRFLEAAETDDRQPSARLKPAGPATCWLPYDHDFEDRVGWGDVRLAEEREMRFRRLPPSRPAIERHAEVMEWTRLILSDPEHRHCAWAWARCKVRERSFRQWCRRTDRHPRTSLQRAMRAYDLIAAHFRGNGQIPTLPDSKWVFAEDEEYGTFPAIIEDAAYIACPTSWADPDHKPFDTLTDEAAVEQFERFLARTRKRRRRQQEARAAA